MTGKSVFVGVVVAVALLAAGWFAWQRAEPQSAFVAVKETPDSQTGSKHSTAALQTLGTSDSTSVRAALPADIPGEVTYASVSNDYPGAFEVVMSQQPVAGSALDAFNAAQNELTAGKWYAGVKMYLAIRPCQEREIAEQMRELDDARNTPPIYDVLLARNEQSLSSCRGTGPAEIARAYDGLRQGADRGDVAAQLLYATVGELEFSSKQEMLRAPEKIVRYREDSMRYLNAAATRGSVQAMQILSGVYKDGVITRQDLPKSYVYRYADYLLAPGALTRQSAERAASRLTSEQVSAARVQAQKFLEKCCSG